MAGIFHNLLSKASRDVQGGLRDLRAMLAARWALGRLEIDVAVGQLKRLAIVLTSAAVLILTALPVLIVALARSLPHSTAILWFAGGALLLLGAIAGLIAWRRFRREFSPLEDSLAELHEDVTWLREWTRDEEAE
ncbi:MAG: phage holin family protein [Planctomycetes bacterium]|nr:phage holin family protein [Planctomycetota bacterium]